MEREVTIRAAYDGDSVEIADLLGQLGYPRNANFVSGKLQHLSQSAMDQVFVALIDSQVVGVVSLHILPLFHEEGDLCRITALVVSKSHRRQGIGGKLMEFAEDFARSNGCIRIEVTPGERRADAQAFYGRLGYKEVSRRFMKSI